MRAGAASASTREVLCTADGLEGGDARARGSTTGTLWAEACTQLWLVLPIAGANLLQRTPTWVTWATVGHLGAEFLGPVTLASSVNNVLGTSVVGGLATGISTLASQAFGARDNLALSRVLQKAVLVVLLGSVPCVLLLLTMRPLLLLLHMGLAFADRACHYALSVLLVTPCMGVQRAIGMWLVAQKVNGPRLAVQAAIQPVHAVLTWLLALRTSWGYIGAGLAMTLSNALQMACMYTYISCSPTCSQSWRGFSKEAVRDWGPFLQFAVPGVLMNAEYWVGESLTFAAGLLNDPDTCLSALSIYQLTQTTCYQVPSAIRMSVSTRVGNQLGAGEPAMAAVSARAGLRLVLLWLCLPTTALLTFKHSWSAIFTRDAQVLAMLQSLVPPLLLYSGTDAVLAYYNGVLAACGQQAISGRWALRGYVCVGLPLALLLAFGLRWGVAGLVLGHCVGKLCHCLPCARAAWRLDWPSEATRAVERVRRISQ